MKGMGSLLRMVRHRWWVVVLLAVLGGGSAYAVTTLRNGQIKPQFEATAVVAFSADQNERDKNILKQELGAAGAEAAELTVQYIDEGLGKVSTDDRASTIIFTTRGRDEASAIEAATAMRNAYLEGLAAKARVARQERLDEIVTEAAQLLTQIETLSPPVVEEIPDVPTEILTQLDELESLASALTSERTKSEVDLILAKAGDDRVGTPEEIQAELDAVDASLDDVYAQIAAITTEHNIDPSRIGQKQPNQNSSGGSSSSSSSGSSPGQQSQLPPLGEGPITTGELTDQWTVEALTERYNTLSEEYASFFTDVTDTSGEELAAVEVANTAPAQGSPLLYAVLGALAGALMAVSGLFVQKRVRGTIFAPSDVVPIPVLTELPPVSLLERRPDSRKQRTAVTKRLEGVRRLRSTLLTFSEESSRAPAIGLSGVGIDREQVRFLALDVARRLAASDRSVVLLDLDFDFEFAYEQSLDGVSVAGLLSRVREDPTSGVEALEAALEHAAPGKGALNVIRAGRMNDDPTDLVLTDGFRILTDQARQHADLVMVMLPGAADPLTKSVSRRFDGMIGVCAVGVSRRSFLANVIPDGAVGGSQAVGVALLVGRGAHAGKVRRALDDGDPDRMSQPTGESPVFATESGSKAALMSPRPPGRSSAQSTASRRTATEKPSSGRGSGLPVQSSRTDVPSTAGALAPTSRSVETWAPASPWTPASEVGPAAQLAADPTPMVRPRIDEQAVQQGRLKRTLERVENALENVIALPSPTYVALPPPKSFDEPRRSGERGSVGHALDRFESILGRFIAPPDPSPASGGWTSSRVQDRY